MLAALPKRGLMPDEGDWNGHKNKIMKYGNCDNYQLAKKLGRGKYGEVFEAIRPGDDRKFAIKILKPISKEKVYREIKILEELRGGPNIIQLCDVLKLPPLPNQHTHALVFDLYDTDFKTFSQTLPLVDREIRHYLKQLLIALNYCHSCGIMHRDVKPHNILINLQKKKLCLADWGLAEFYHADYSYNVAVASRYFKSPELLIGFNMYNCSIDMWGVGCILAGLIFRKDIFFKGVDDYDQLKAIVKVLGSESMKEYLRKIKGQLKSNGRNLGVILNNYPKLPWEAFITQSNDHIAKSEAIDLLDSLLLFDHEARITAKEALGHPYLSLVTKKDAATEIERK